jgi:hypothetical protein
MERSQIGLDEAQDEALARPASAERRAESELIVDHYLAGAPVIRWAAADRGRQRVPETEGAVLT